MKPAVLLCVAASLWTPPGVALRWAHPLNLRGSLRLPSQDAPKKPDAPDQQPGEPPVDDHKKPKKVWTNENLHEVNTNGVSQVGDEKNRPAGKTAPGKAPNSQVVASFRKQLVTLQSQAANVDKEIADLKAFSKGEAPGAVGLQLHKSYSTEPIEDQIRKLEEKKTRIAGQIDTLLDAARKLGIEPGQLR